MPHSNQAKKRLRQNEKRRQNNRTVRSAMKTHIKRVLQAVENGDAAAAKMELPVAMKKIDKAAKKKIIHEKQASRKVSRLSKKVNSLDKKENAESAENAV